MLRITVTERPDGAAIVVEGRLAGPNVDELARCWDALPAPAGVVDLDAVTFIDAAGKILLRRLHRAGARLLASGCMTRAIVDEIAGAGEGPR